MGFFKSLKGNVQVGTDDLGTTQSVSRNNEQYVSGTHDELSTRKEKQRVFGTSSSLNPFSRSSASQTPPQPQSQSETFSPPPGPPSQIHSHAQQHSSTFSPPPGPPPSHSALANPPPYHDWTVIPDTSLLPPPPALPQEYSPTNNASYESAEAAHRWCAKNPAFTPFVPASKLHATAQSGELSLEVSQALNKNAEVRKVGPGVWGIKTRKGQQDAILLSNLPLYFAAVDSPLRTEREKVIYFELHVLGIRDNESGVAIGFAAKPYPPWRLPGWHRASLGVHGDDGRRFVNDSWGGREFVGAFEVGDIVGLGMRYVVGESEGGNGGMGSEKCKCKTKAFFTRNGREEGGGWDVDEERDAERDEGVEGLQGELDMYPAVGVFGGVEVEVRFRREDWVHKVT